jgi:uncharacterized protein (UPF0276 family)
MEVHSENYFAAGGPLLRSLHQVRKHYPLSLHGVGLSLGSSDPIDTGHLASLKRLVRDVEPMLVSEHLSWASVGGRFVNDLLPLPFTEEALRHLAQRVTQVQEELDRQILIENVSSYLRFRCSQMSEWEFLTELTRTTGCGVLLDVNNVFVSAMNHGFDPCEYLLGLPANVIREVHLAGHTVTRIGDREIRIDTHSDFVCPAVWRLYSFAVQRFGALPTLIEWDSELPALDDLIGEAMKAERIMERCNAVAA